MDIDALVNGYMPSEIILLTAKRIRTIRKRKKISQEELSKRSGVSLSSLKRFEHTGEISYFSLVKLACALEIENELVDLFVNVPYQSIEEILREKDS